MLERAFRILDAAVAHESPVDHGISARRPDIVCYCGGAMSIYRFVQIVPEVAEPRRHGAEGVPCDRPVASSDCRASTTDDCSHLGYRGRNH